MIGTTVYCQFVRIQDAPFSISLGPPIGFCSGRRNAQYVNPKNHAQFFSCIGGRASECQVCRPGTFFDVECSLCLKRFEGKLFLLLIIAFNYFILL